MSIRKFWLVLLTIGFALSLSLFPLLMLQAQSTDTLLSLAVPEYMGSQIKEEMLKKFEEAHAGVKVKLVKTGSDNYYPPAYDTDKFFEGSEKYAQSADVLYVSTYTMMAEATRAGYFLDLNPLIKSDAALNVDDFIPAAWQSFAWDNAQWAMPVKMDVLILSYDPKAFDKAGVPYPNEKWTLDDLIDAGIKLTKKDANGNITDPGLLIYNTAPLFRSLMDEPFYDASTTPTNPKFDNPQLESLVEKWAKFTADTKMVGQVGDYNAIPLRLEQSYSIVSNTGNPYLHDGSLLPGGKAGITADGFGISSGTQHPELAYELLKYLVTEPTIYNAFYGFKSALKNPQASDNSQFGEMKFSPENQAVLDAAIANAIPASEYRFWDYISKAISDMEEKKIDAKTALQAAEQQAVNVLQKADDKHSKNVVTVATLVPTPVLNANEVSLKFNMTAYISPLPNKDLWDKVIKDFTGSDSEVRYISFETDMGSSIKELAQKVDCFSLPFNAVSPENLTDLLNLDPLMSADAEFDKNDVIANTLGQFQKDNKTFAIPLNLQPQVLRYNTDEFTKANVPMPKDTWTIDEFNDALKRLKANGTEPVPFVPMQYGGNYLLMLIASYGGLPIDTRTTPATISYTDQATADAIRQVLDLAQQGYIKYQKLASNFGGGGGGGGNLTIPIYTDSISMSNFYGPRVGDDTKDPYKYVQYPKGTQYTPVSFDVGAGYISASSAHPEACYRWLKTLTKHPELFSSMPAFRSALESDGAKAQGAEAVAFFKAFDAQAQDASALVIPAQVSSVGEYINQFVLFRAFDRYVLEDKDLDTELKDAETFSKSNNECTANIPAFTGSTQEESMAYYKQFTDCAIKIDPSLKQVLSPN